MKITVNTLDGQSCELEVQPTDSIKEVKTRIRDEWHIPNYLQQLMFESKKLKNKETLASLKIGEEGALYLTKGSADGTKVAAGGYGIGRRENQFCFPYGFVLDRDRTMIIVDWGNHRIIEWKGGAEAGTVLVGKEGQGKKPNQLSGPTDVAIDQQTNDLIICDRGNRRVMRWPRYGNAGQGEVLIKDIACWGVAMDQQRNLYVSDTDTHTVKRYPYPPGDHAGDIVIGSRDHGRGMQLNQLNEPSYIFVDPNQNVYVTDTWNHRVMKWEKATNKVSVAARGFTRGLFVDAHETVYVADYGNHKIMRWPKGKGEGEVINVRYMEGDEEDELFAPWTVCYDGKEHIYVGDHTNQRIQRFPLK